MRLALEEPPSTMTGSMTIPANVRHRLQFPADRDSHGKDWFFIKEILQLDNITLCLTSIRAKHNRTPKQYHGQTAGSDTLASLARAQYSSPTELRSSPA